MLKFPSSLTKFLWHFTAKQRTRFFILLIAHLAWSIDQTILPYIFKIFIERISEYNGDKLLVWPHIQGPILAGALVWLLIEVMFRVFDYHIARFKPKFQADIRQSVFNYIQQHSYKFFSDNFAGSIVNKINDLTNSSFDIVSKIITLYFPSFIAILVGTIIFASFHPSFALVLLLWLILHFSVCFSFARRCNDLAKIHSESRSILTGKLVDNLTNIIAVKSFASETEEENLFKKQQDDEQEKQEESLKLIFKIKILLGILSFFFCGIMLTWLEVQKWQTGVISTAEFIYIFYTSWGLCIFAWVTGNELPALFRDIGICRQALSLLKEDLTPANDLQAINVTKGAIEFKQVDFFYNPKDKLFANLNVKIAPQEKIGLVGFSGSGKTSFANLILAFFSANKGQICIDDQDINKATKTSLRKFISFIPQDPNLFHRSLLENIAYGKPNASKEEIYAAAKLAHCDEFIQKLPDGYNTKVGERGIKLSGGQRQRIAIARAILKEAPILVLDEATSALDSVTETLIQNSLNHLMQNRTAIIIAHRLSTLSEMDRILVFEQGKIVEDGHHNELLKKKGHYYRMWKMQSGGFMPEKK